MALAKNARIGIPFLAFQSSPPRTIKWRKSMAALNDKDLGSDRQKSLRH